jgi:hypothetical protein
MNEQEEEEHRAAVLFLGREEGPMQSDTMRSMRLRG